MWHRRSEREEGPARTPRGLRRCNVQDAELAPRQRTSPWGLSAQRGVRGNLEEELPVAVDDAVPTLPRHLDCSFSLRNGKAQGRSNRMPIKTAGVLMKKRYELLNPVRDRVGGDLLPRLNKLFWKRDRSEPDFPPDVPLEAYGVDARKLANCAPRLAPG